MLLPAWSSAAGPPGKAPRCLASSAVSRRVLLLDGCAPAPRSVSGVCAGDGASPRDGQRARLLDVNGLTLGSKRRATASSCTGH
jgi:hypothetical protein